MEVIVGRVPAVGGCVPHGFEVQRQRGGRVAAHSHRPGHLGRLETLHGRNGELADRRDEFDRPVRVEEDPAVLSFRPDRAARRDDRVPVFIDDVQTRRGGLAVDAGPDRHRAGSRAPVHLVDGDGLHRPAARADPLQLGAVVVVGLGKVDPFPVVAEGRRQRHAEAAGQQDRGIRRGQRQQAQFMAAVVWPGVGEKLAVGRERHVGLRRQSVFEQLRGRVRERVVYLDEIAAVVLVQVEQQDVFGKDQRPAFERPAPQVVGRRDLLPVQCLERDPPELERAAFRRAVVDVTTVGREHRVEVDGFDVHQHALVARPGVHRHDVQLAAAVADEHDIPAVRRPFRARVHAAGPGDAACVAGIEIHHPQPAAGREREALAVRRRRRVHRTGIQDRQLVAFQVDMMAVASDPRILVGPLRKRGRGQQRGQNDQHDSHRHGVAPDIVVITRPLSLAVAVLVYPNKKVGAARRPGYPWGQRWQRLSSHLPP